MSAGDRELIEKITSELTDHAETVASLPGIEDVSNLASLVLQVRDSVHRVRYVQALKGARPDPGWSDPNNAAVFNPLKAAAEQLQNGNVDEATWFIFLFVHFGKNLRGGWRYCREVYGRLGQGSYWTWANVSSNVGGFLAWLETNRATIQRRDVPGGFGNHRKYLSLKAYSRAGTGMAVASYVDWVMAAGGHRSLFSKKIAQAHGDRKEAFEIMYGEMQQIASFGRLARFDFLAMLGKLGLADIEPGRPYLLGATGPTLGAKLLFTGSTISKARENELERKVIDLGERLSVGPFSMQVLEDALCNWQKSPSEYRRFWG